MTTPKYRISMVVWDYESKTPRSSALLENYAVESFATHKAISDATIETSRLNEEWHKENPGHVENPFVLDDCSDCTAIIRFWDGDDYMPVEMYDVYEILDKGDNWLYRNYRICAKEGSFQLEKNNVFVASVSSLVKALDLVDSLEVKNTVVTV